MPLTLDGNTGVQGNSGAFVAGTAVASTSGTSIDFTGIPSWVKRITVMCNGVSTNGAGRQQLQLGTGGTPATSGYTAGYMFNSTNNSTIRSINSFTTGFPNFADEAADFYTGTYVLTLITGNTWMCSGTGTIVGANAGNNIISGSIALAGTLNMIRFTTTSTPTFDAGTINITYE
jgi:hypothetical protein